MKALILAGGTGSRLRPITYSMAKQLVPVANKPVIEYGIEAIAEAGVKEFGIIVGDTGPAVEKAVGRKLKLASMPWWVLRAGSPFVPMWKAIVSMSYLRFEEHRLVSTRLPELVGHVPHTALDEAVVDTLADLGLLASAVRSAA